MTYAEAIQFLYDLRWFGAKLGLDQTRQLAALAGDPQDRLRFVHVAGTNGKGSTCAMLESIYRAAGWRVGLFTSPHLVSFAERIQVNRQPIPESEVVRLVSELQPWLRQFPAEAHPTFFEVVTVMALRWFAEQRCDLVVWETGLGGRLDATNIVTPLASVITNIGLEHQQWLGETIAEIAAEKAGILKPGVPAVTAARAGEGLEVITAIARERGVPLTMVTEADATKPPLDTLVLPLPGHHQQLNAATALATVRVLAPQLPVTDAQLRAGLAALNWPGRLQRVPLPDGRLLVLDGAHNPASVAVLRTALAAEFPGPAPTLVFGVCRDKDWQAMCRALAPLAGRLVLVPIKSERTLAPAEMVPECRAANPRAVVHPCGSLAEALQTTGSDPFVVVTGSLYLIGEALELLHLSATPPADEKGLNEWPANRLPATA